MVMRHISPGSTCSQILVTSLLGRAGLADAGVRDGDGGQSPGKAEFREKLLAGSARREHAAAGEPACLGARAQTAPLSSRSTDLHSSALCSLALEGLRAKARVHPWLDAHTVPGPGCGSLLTQLYRQEECAKEIFPKKEHPRTPAPVTPAMQTLSEGSGHQRGTGLGSQSRAAFDFWRVLCGRRTPFPCLPPRSDMAILLWREPPHRTATPQA